MAGNEQDMNTLAPPRPYQRVTAATPRKVAPRMTLEQKVVTAISVPLAGLAGVCIGHALCVLVGLA